MAHRQWSDATSLANKGTKNEAYFNYQKKYEQMTKQTQLIEQKKLEIQKRNEEKKKKETEEALKKLNDDKLKASESSRSKRYGYSKSKHWSGRDRPEVNVPVVSPANIFSNDGSFLEQFQKISGVRVDVKRRSSDHSYRTSEKNNANNDSEEPCNEALIRGIKDADKERFFSQDKNHQPQMLQHHQQIQHPQQTIQHMQMHQQPPLQQQMQQQPPLQQHMFTPQQMHYPTVPPPMNMNYPPQFNPMQCGGMMLPPPMTPSSIPPPAPLNPGSIPSPSPLQPCSIPSPSPLQPCSIPSPSPLQPYSIPPPSPLIPHSIPPPSPMVPHSIPPPSPLTPHSIPPPSPLRPQTIPPPVQRAPLFLTMAPPPPPPPPPEVEKPKVQSAENVNHSENKTKKPEPNDEPKPVKGPKRNLKNSVKELFNRDDYSSSSSSSSLSEDEEELQGRQYGPSIKQQDHSDSSDSEQDHGPFIKKQVHSDSSDSELRRKISSDSESDKESDADTNHKEDTLSEVESDVDQQSQTLPEPEYESDIMPNQPPKCDPIVIEDTATQFPTDTKDSDNNGETAPPDLCSESDSQPEPKKGSNCDTPLFSPLANNAEQSCYFEEEEVKKEPEDDIYEDSCEMKNEYNIKVEEMDINNPNEEIIPEIKSEVKEELSFEVKPEVKQETIFELFSAKSEVKQETSFELFSTKSEVKQKTGFESFCAKSEVKQETAFESNSAVTEASCKSEEPPVKKKRRSRWATVDEEEKVEIPTVIPPLPPQPPTVTPPNIRPPIVGPVGMVAPTVLGGVNTIMPPLPPSVPTISVPGMSGAMISKVTRTDPALTAYAMKAFGRTNLTDVEWKKAEDHYKINLLYQDMMRKREELQRLQAAGKNKYEYDSDEETDGGTWEHKLRYAEMEATQLWADELTEQAKGKHHIGDFLPPDELARFMEKYEALKDGREPDLSDYKEFKLKEDNIGFQMLQKLGWTEGQGLGPDGSGITDPVNKGTGRLENQGLGVDRPDDVEADDDEYDAYRKRMMLAYRFRPNPMNNPRRPYY